MTTECQFSRYLVQRLILSDAGCHFFFFLDFFDLSRCSPCSLMLLNLLRCHTLNHKRGIVRVHGSTMRIPLCETNMAHDRNQTH
jgi:hypothetical protein